MVHADIAHEFLPVVAAALDGVELVGDDCARAVVDRIGPATDDDYATEFLDLKMSVRVVDDLDSAIEHVQANSSGHSEAIVTTDLAAADRFAPRSRCCRGAGQRFDPVRRR